MWLDIGYSKCLYTHTDTGLYNNTSINGRYFFRCIENSSTEKETLYTSLEFDSKSYRVTLKKHPCSFFLSNRIMVSDKIIFYIHHYRLRKRGVDLYIWLAVAGKDAKLVVVGPIGLL